MNFLDNEDGIKDRQRRANFETTMEYAGILIVFQMNMIKVEIFIYDVSHDACVNFHEF